MLNKRTIAVAASVAAACAIVGVACSAKLARLDPPRPSAVVGIGATLEGKQVFPADNPWNRDISGRPVDPRSAKLVASIGAERPFHPDFGTVYDGHPNGIPYIVISGEQTKKFAPVTF